MEYGEMKLNRGKKGIFEEIEKSSNILCAKGLLACAAITTVIGIIAVITDKSTHALTFLSHNTIGVIGDSREQYSAWSNYPDYIGTQTYTFDTGLSETFRVNNMLLNLLNKHMAN